MKTITMQQLRSYNPCYDPIKYLPENWSGTAIDILQHKTIPYKDKLWAVLRSDILSDKILRLFAISCARSCLHLARKEDQEVLNNTIEVAFRFAYGQATQEELDAAWSAAESVAYSAARGVAYSAASSVAWSAARSVRSAAWSAAQELQIKNLIKLIELLDGSERHE